jgi:4-hydroxybenzoate polyprenyltransferase
VPILLSFAVLFWTAGFDIIYALQDEEFDKSNQLHSIPSFLGKKQALNVSKLLHTISATLIVVTGYYLGTGIWYWIGTAAYIGLLVNQHRLVKVDDLSKINLAFFTTNGIASIVFASFGILSLYF